MNLKGICLVIWNLLLLSYITNAQTANELSFIPNNINDRLPHSDVNTIIQDTYGFLWFGTYNGLSRYDGENLTIFKKDLRNSKPGAEIRDIDGNPI